MGTTFDCLVCGAANVGSVTFCEHCAVEFASVRKLSSQDYVQAITRRLSRARLAEPEARAKELAAARALQGIPLTVNLGHMRALLALSHRMQTHLEALAQDDRAVPYRTKSLAVYRWILRQQPDDPFLRPFRAEYHPEAPAPADRTRRWPLAVAITAAALALALLVLVR